MSRAHIVGRPLSPELEARVRTFLNPPWLSPEALRWERLAGWIMGRALARTFRVGQPAVAVDYSQIEARIAARL
jgi:hypothetical protein